jgi:mono/diheme cytochrome c family protein
MAAQVSAYALAGLALLSIVVWRGGAAAATAHNVRFNRDVQPILADKCFACHGPDANKRQAELRLDVRDSALAERNGVRAIVPGDTDASELVRRTRSQDPDYRMPPPTSNRTLSRGEIDVLAQWVAQGAAYEPHWSYTAVSRPALPDVQQPDWATNPIDRFALARLEAQDVRPSPPADRRTLARRPSFDLTGLPPDA